MDDQGEDNSKGVELLIRILLIIIGALLLFFATKLVLGKILK